MMEAKLKKYCTLLGATVLPLAKRRYYQASNFDSLGMLNYAKGDERQRLARSIVDSATKEQRLDNKRMSWTIWAVKADGTFQLLSDLGYSQDNVSRSDFRVIKTDSNV